MLPQLLINVRLFPQATPQEDADENYSDGEGIPPGPLMVAAQGLVNFPFCGTGFAGGELDRLTFHLHFIICGLCCDLRAQGQVSFTVQSSDKKTFWNALDNPSIIKVPHSKFYI